MRKAILYLRVSSKEQLDGSSIETQGRICTDFALKNDYEVDKVFIEKGESAKTADRTELKGLLDYVGKNHKHLNAVVVYKIDRLARNTLDHAQLKLLFNKYGLKLISATENLEDTPVGRLLENQLAGFAQFDNEIRAERCKNGMIAAVKSGRYTWKAPIGYINSGTKGSSNIIPDNEKTVRLIRKIWELIDIGYSVEEARKEITKQGLKNRNGKAISKSHFHRMVKNKIYMGVIEKFGLCIIGNFKAIIEPALFNRVYDKLVRNRKNIPIYKKDNIDFPLRSLIRHVNCGRRLTASWSKGRNNKYPYYRCLSCKGINIKKELIEEQFIEYLSQFNYSPTIKDLLVEAIKANIEHRRLSNKKNMERLEKQIYALKEKEKQIVEKNLKNVINDILAKELIDNNSTELTKLTLELDEYKENEDDISNIVNYGLTLLTDIGDVWKRADFGIKKRFQKFLFPQGVLYDGHYFRTDKIALCIDKKLAISQDMTSLVALTGIEPVSRP